ncbi:hypothetical protein DAKH74_012830 [Maudiozyma humilis]|uniref:Uncharacterized protein n=1 Tax=Maudiozyma humilis TaxID=51915 RepID=A0AAV5RVC2_MAUHU|nr:hypothetical protein DAKH74_012830 [Kazachstania humilis]
MYITTVWHHSTLQHVVSAMSLTPEQRAQLKTRILDEIAKKRAETEEKLDALKDEHLVQLQAAARQQIEHFRAMPGQDRDALIRDVLQRERESPAEHDNAPR